MADCYNCPYSKYPKIPPSRIKKADVAIVGEAPGATEIARKKPFVGASGQLLRKALSLVGLPSADNIFITNAMLCKPPTGKLIKKGAVVNCRKRLLRELQQVQPKVIIALGNTAMHTLTDRFDLKITKEQGRVLDSSILLLDCKIVPAFHPAAILRDGSKYRHFLASLRRAKEVLQHGDVNRPPDPSYEVVQTGKQLDEVKEDLVKQQYLAADIETSGTFLSGEILDLGIAWKPGSVLIFPGDMVPYLKDLFSHPHPKWIWQHGKYDLKFLHQRGIPARLDEDTMILHYCLNENPGTHDLEQLCAYYFGDEPYKNVVDKYTKGQPKSLGYANVPKDVLYPYLAKDCDRTLRLFFKLRPEVMADGRLKKLYYELLLPASRFLIKVEMKGLFVDKEELKAKDTELTERLEKITNYIKQLAEPLWDAEEYRRVTGAKSAPKYFNPGSVPQLKWLLYDRLRLTGNKKRSTDADALKAMKEQHDIVDAILEFRSVRKLHSTYIKAVKRLTDVDGRIHSIFNVHGTVTGRLSSSEPNVQNVTKEMRVLYRAEPGYTLIEADYKAAELRTLAYISGDDYLKEVFRQGRDLHGEVAEALQIDRMQAKTINFGIAYGRTAHSISEAFGINYSEAQRMIDDWFERAPKAYQYLKSCDEAVIKGEILATPLGRLRRFGLITDQNFEDLQKEARNFRIQSIASDMTLISAITMQPKLEQIDAHVINLVHDSILVECPENEVYKAAKIIVSTMEETPRRVLNSEVPFEVDIKVGYNWGKLKEVELSELIK